MTLSSSTIRSKIKEGLLEITPFKEENVKPASYTLTLGETLKIQGETLPIPASGYLLNPGEFIVGYTEEKLNLMGNFACNLSARGSCAQIGLSVLLSDTFAEPDTNCALALAIHNVSSKPITLVHGMKIVKGIFTNLD